MILLVDDDASFAGTLKRFLKHAGFEVISVISGIDALRHLAAFKPDLIILDLIMKPPDGFELLRVIRRDPVFKNVPILVYSADISRDAETRALEEGAQDFIVKGTVGLQPLVQRVHNLIGNPQTPGDLAD